MKCIFKHDWIYSEKVYAEFNEEKGTYIYRKRTCKKCGIVEEENGFFDTSFGIENNFKYRWVRIK